MTIRPALWAGPIHKVRRPTVQPTSQSQGVSMLRHKVWSTDGRNRSPVTNKVRQLRQEALCLSTRLADSGRYETPYRESSYPQSQANHGRTGRDERHTNPWNADTTYLGDGQSGRDSFRRGEQRDYDSPRQTHEGRTHHQSGYQPSYGRPEPNEQRNTYEEQGYGHGGVYGESHSFGHREEERRSSTHQQHRVHQYEESRQGYGDYSRSERRQEYDDRMSSQRVGREYGVSDSYGERQGTYGSHEYGRSGGGGYDDSSRTDRYGDAQNESYGRRSGGYDANEDTFGAERLNLNAVEGGYSRQRGYGSREEEGGYEY